MVKVSQEMYISVTLQLEIMHNADIVTLESLHSHHYFRRWALAPGQGLRSESRTILKAFRLSFSSGVYFSNH